MAVELIVIHCVAPDYAYDEEYSVHEDLVAPICEKCGRVMEYISKCPVDEDGDYLERWRCPNRNCLWRSTCWPGMYGEREIVMNQQEWDDYQRQKWTKKWLERRYGTTAPASIRDYWLRNKTSEG